MVMATVALLIEEILTFLELFHENRIDVCKHPNKLCCFPPFPPPSFFTWAGHGDGTASVLPHSLCAQWQTSPADHTHPRNLPRHYFSLNPVFWQLPPIYQCTAREREHGHHSCSSGNALSSLSLARPVSRALSRPQTSADSKLFGIQGSPISCLRKSDSQWTLRY